MAEHEHSPTSSPATGGDLRVVVVTPEETAIDTTARLVVVPLFDGELGILPGRAPLIGRLGYGELRIGEGSKPARYYVDGGFVQVAQNVVTLLTGRAVPAHKLDREVAAEQLRAAQARKANSPETFAIRDRLVAQSRAQLHLASRK